MGAEILGTNKVVLKPGEIIIDRTSAIGIDNFRSTAYPFRAGPQKIFRQEVGGGILSARYLLQSGTIFVVGEELSTQIPGLRNVGDALMAVDNSERTNLYKYDPRGVLLIREATGNNELFTPPQVLILGGVTVRVTSG